MNLEVRYLDYFAKQKERKGDHPDVSKPEVGAISVSEKTLNQILNCNKTKIGYTIYRIRQELQLAASDPGYTGTGQVFAEGRIVAKTCE